MMITVNQLMKRPSNILSLSVIPCIAFTPVQFLFHPRTPAPASTSRFMALLPPVPDKSNGCKKNKGER
jgi:hypothetical protein